MTCQRRHFLGLPLTLALALVLAPVPALVFVRTYRLPARLLRLDPLG